MKIPMVCYYLSLLPFSEETTSYENVEMSENHSPLPMEYLFFLSNFQVAQRTRWGLLNNVSYRETRPGGPNLQPLIYHFSH